MICLNSTKSSYFAICLTNSGQKSLTMFISSCCNNYLIDLNKKNKRLRLRRDSNPQSLGLRLRNTCAIGCAKKTDENVFNQLFVNYDLSYGILYIHV